MSIQNIDPVDIKEIIETDTVRTGVFTPEATEKYKEQLDGCTAITVEGMQLKLVRFDILKKRNGTRKAVMYVKVNPELGQLLYAVSDHSDAEQVREEIFPALINMANQTGLVLVDVRAVATESIGSLKRAKGVINIADLNAVLVNEVK